MVAKAISCRFQFCFKGSIVIYLAIVSDHIAISILHGHVSGGGKIKEGKAAVAEDEMGGSITVQAFIIGAAVLLCVAHFFHL